MDDEKPKRGRPRVPTKPGVYGQLNGVDPKLWKEFRVVCIKNGWHKVYAFEQILRFFLAHSPDAI